MTVKELHGWMRYRQTWGPLDVVRRYDRPGALAAAAVAGADSLESFLPWPRRHYTEAERFARELMGYGQ